MGFFARFFTSRNPSTAHTFRKVVKIDKSCLRYGDLGRSFSFITIIFMDKVHDIQLGSMLYQFCKIVEMKEVTERVMVLKYYEVRQ